VFYSHLETRVGRLLVAGDEAGLHAIAFPGGARKRRPEPDWREDRRPLREALRQLEAYFAGALREFELPLAPRGTPFQLRVWTALRGIPYGETASYGEIARRIGRPGAARAVGLANGANPLPIVVPCHRVIGQSGALTGFGGGLPTKRALLELERRVACPSAQMTLAV
jgi:methylated-DNA-[protein]-cysteine S-methyltransferase